MLSQISQISQTLTYGDKLKIKQITNLECISSFPLLSNMQSPAGIWDHDKYLVKKMPKDYRPEEKNWGVPDPVCQFLQNAVAILDENNIYENEVAHLLSVVSETLRKFNSYIHKTFQTVVGKKEKWIHFGFILDEIPDRILEIETAYFKKAKEG